MNLPGAIALAAIYFSDLQVDWLPAILAGTALFINIQFIKWIL